MKKEEKWNSKNDFGNKTKCRIKIGCHQNLSEDSCQNTRQIF